MSSSNFASTIDLALRPSLLALKLLFGLHIALVMLALLAVPQGPPMLVLAALFALSWFSLRRHPAFGYGPRALTRLTWHAEGHWTLHAGSAQQDAVLMDNSFVHPRLLVLNFRLPSGRRRTRVLLGDLALR